MLFFLLVFLESFLLFAQDNKAIEKKWGIESNTSSTAIEFSKLPKNFDSIFPMHLEPHRAEAQVFQINPNMENKITGKFGTELIFPANSISLPSFFRRGDIVNIELREIVNDLDFLTFGTNMLFYDSKSKPHIFESGGMLELKAIYFNRELSLKKGAKIKVKFPVIFSERKMKIYKLSENGSWIEKSELDKLPDQNGETNILFGFLDGFGIWNLDYPNPEISCIQGTIEPISQTQNPPYIVSVVGLSSVGAYSKNFNEAQFKVNVLKDQEVKIIVGDSKGNFGYKDIKAPSKENFIDFSNYKKISCEEVGTITIKETSYNTRKDRKKLLEFLGLKDRMTPN